jgi:SAM-dependent methyltransferase
MRLNVGCGRRRIEGYTGVDAVERKGADIVAPAWAIPLADESCDEIMAIHLFEHFYRWECERVLAEWHRLLKPRGRLVLELPDLHKCCLNVIKGREAEKFEGQLGMWGLYGDPRDEDPYMTHRWGWTPATLRALLEANGFDRTGEERTEFHPVGRQWRDMRIVAEKAQA